MTTAEFLELSRLVRTVARAGSRGLILLWNGAPAPELAQQLGLPSVAGNGDLDYDRALIASCIERASQPPLAPASAPRAATSFTTNWASAQSGAAVATLAPPPAAEPEEFAIPFVQAEAKPRRGGFVVPVVAVLGLAVGAAAAAPWALTTLSPMLNGHSIAGAPCAFARRALGAVTGNQRAARVRRRRARRDGWRRRGPAEGRAAFAGR